MRGGHRRWTLARRAARMSCVVVGCGAFAVSCGKGIALDPLASAAAQGDAGDGGDALDVNAADALASDVSPDEDAPGTGDAADTSPVSDVSTDPAVDARDAGADTSLDADASSDTAEDSPRAD